MSSRGRREHEYASELWDRLAFAGSTKIVTPPDKQGIQLPLQPLNEFRELPGMDDFGNRFNELPHAVLNLGHGALLALVNDVSRRNSIYGAMQRVVALSVQGEWELTRDQVSDYGLALGSGWISGEQGEPTPSSVLEYVATLFAVDTKVNTNWRLRNNKLGPDVKVVVQAETVVDKGGELQKSGSGLLYVPAEWTEPTPTQ